MPAARLASAVLGRVDEVRERLREVQQLQQRVAAALDSAREALAQARVALAAALAMPVKEKCGGCHGAREAAIAAAEAALAGAEERIRTCQPAADLLSPLAARLQQALGRLRQVPQNLGDAYELVCQFIRKAGNCRLWPAGSKARGPGGEREPGSPDHPAGRGLRRMIAVPTGLWVSRRRERSRDYNPVHRARRSPSSGPGSRD